MRRAKALALALALCGTYASVGCGSRFVGRVTRDGSGPDAEAGMQAPPDGGPDGGGDALVDLSPGGMDAPVDGPDGPDAPVDGPDGTDAPVDGPDSTDAPVDGPGGTDAPVDGPTGGADGPADGPPGGADAHTDAPPEGPPVAPPGLPQVCTIDGWCWTHPLPTGDRFVDAFKVADDDLWLVGAAGTIVRYAGGKLLAIPSPASTLATLWATGAKDVWVGGPDGPFHWDGDGWHQIGITTQPSLRAVDALWGCGPDDIWAMGPIVTHWDGHNWVSVTVPSDALLTDHDFRAVWGSACDDVWAGSLQDSSGMGAIYHYDGKVWAKVEARPAEQLVGIGSSDLWSLAQGRLSHSNGVDAGTLVTDRAMSVFAIGALGAGVMNDAHEVALLGSGGTSTPLPVPAPSATSTLRGWAPNDLLGLGGAGTAVHWNGSDWESRLPAWQLGAGDATRVTGSGPYDLWAAVGGALWQGDGTSWKPVLAADAIGGQIIDLYAPGPGEVWVLGGDNLVHHLRGGAWTVENPLPGAGTPPPLRAISGTGANDVWIARGTNVVLHWDGNGWTSREVTLYQGGAVNTLSAVWAAAPNDVWLVGDGISHWLNGAWVAPPQFPAGTVGIAGPYVAVSGSAPDDVHFLLATGYVLVATDSNRTLVEELNSGSHPVTLVPAPPKGVWAMFDDVAADLSRLYLLGRGPTGGNAAGPVAPGGLKGLWSASDGTLWAAGRGGSLLRRAPSP